MKTPWDMVVNALAKLLPKRIDLYKGSPVSYLLVSIETREDFGCHYIHCPPGRRKKVERSHISNEDIELCVD